MTRRRLLRFGIPAAAAALILLIAGPPSKDEQPTHRAPTITAAPAPTPVTPVGVVTAAPLLRWTAVEGADRYRVNVFDAGGVVLYETESADTVAPLPDSLRLESGRAYLWKVEARTSFGRWVTSELIEFSVAELRR